MDDETPELVLGPYAQRFLTDCTSEERSELLIILYSLLLDPAPDNVNKFDADYYPYTGKGVREYLDDTWYLSYVVEISGSVHALTIYRRKELPLDPNP